MKKKILGLVIATNDLRKNFYIHKDVYNEISKNFNNFYIINFYYLKFFNKKKKILTNFLPKNFKIFTPKSKSDLYKFFSDKEMIAFNALGKDLEYFYILRLIKKLNIKLMLLQNLGDIGNTKIIKIKNIKSYFFKFRYILNYLIFRIFVFINFFPTIELYFESKKDIVKSCEDNKFKKKMESIFPFFKFYYFRKTILINSRSFDELINHKNRLSEENIVFLDTGFFSNDRIIREGKVSKETAKKYFFLLKKFLRSLSKLFKKKIVICLHPSSSINKYKNNLREFIIVKYRTREYIKKAFIVIFHESSSVIDAIFLKKKIIMLSSETMGSYLSEKISSYKKKIKLYLYNLDKQKTINKKKLLIDLNKRKYNKFIRENINSNKETPGRITIIEEINKFFVNQKKYTDNY